MVIISGFFFQNAGPSGRCVVMRVKYSNLEYINREVPSFRADLNVENTKVHTKNDIFVIYF